MISNRTAREDVIREFSGRYAAVHAAHELRQAAELARWVFEIDQVTAARSAALAAVQEKVPCAT
jgi:hypothetical protein